MSIDDEALAAWLNGDGPDPLYADAVATVRSHKRASISLVQRVLKIGYNRAARLIEQMEADGIVSAPDPLKAGERRIVPCTGGGE